MKRRKIYFILGLILSLIISSACGEKNLEVEPDRETKPKESLDDIDRQIEKMTLEEKIGQLMIIGFEGKNFSEEVRLGIEQLKPSGFILFARNIEDSRQTLDLLNEIKKHNKKYNIPLFLAIDEEGGEVSRLPREINKIPSAKELGDLSDLELIGDFGSYNSRVLKSLGFNLNNNPSLDVRYNINNEITKTRSFGRLEEDVSQRGLRMLEASEEAGILSVVKHFPGHGSTDIDSHYKLPIVNKSLEALENEDILPFKKAIDSGVNGIMVAHVMYKHLDGKYPASVSKKVIQDYLIDSLGYKNLIFSDDMTMGAITNSHEPQDAAVLFIKSGGDIAYLCHGEGIGYEFKNSMIRAIEKGEISEAEIDKKLYKILSFKKEYGIEDEILDLPNLEELKSQWKGLMDRKSKDQRKQGIIDIGKK